MSTGSLLTYLGTASSRPWAFLVLIAYVGLWFIFQRQTFDWHAFATMATWAMTLFIQRAEHRDTLALQAKLDELLRSSSGASDELTNIDEKEPEEIESRRKEEDS